MGKISKLPKEIVERISAGEVIERPVSIFKELLENSVDAKSDNILIKVYKGGKEKIVVEDNGEGISFDDLSNLFVRFSTSKIRNIDDIEKILTLGFRGEALASIAAVSHINIISKSKSEEIGGTINATFGEIGKAKKINCNYGTQITVTNIFDNFLARKRFLKSADTELNHILNWLHAFAIAYPTINFHFFRDEQPYYILKKVNSVTERIEAIYGKEIINKTEFLDFADNDYNITVYFNRNTNVPSENFNYTFVNKRHIKNMQLSYILRQAVTGFIPTNKRFSYIIFIETKPFNLDINVHPAKTEVKFKNFAQISDLLIKNLRGYLEKNVTAVSLDWTPAPSTQLIKSSLIPDETIKRQEETGQISHSQQKMFLNNENKFIAQLFNRYILIQNEDHIALYDQHALSEKILLTQYINRILNKQTEIQNLSIPLILDISSEIAEWLKSIIDIWAECGFDFDINPPTKIKINKLPIQFAGFSLTDIQHSFERAYLSSQKELDKKELYYHLLKEFACKNAVKQGDVLNKEEMLKLIATAEQEGLYTCIHGRPVKLILSTSTLDKFFGRT